MQNSIIKHFDIQQVTCSPGAKFQNKSPVIVVVYQAVYAKALEIYSSKQVDDLNRVVLHMGAFHVILNFLAVVGHCFGSAGLRDILIEADIITSGSVDCVHEGHHYNHALRAHKLVSEALVHLRWKKFREWNEQQEHPRESCR